jgi:glutamate dehydrogenase
VPAVAGAYFALAGRLGLGWLRERIHTLPADSHWTTLARNALRDELSELQRAIAVKAIAAAGSADAPGAIIDAWAARNGAALQRAERMLGELRALPSLDLAMLSVALRELRGLA